MLEVLLLDLVIQHYQYDSEVNYDDFEDLSFEMYDKRIDIPLDSIQNIKKFIEQEGMFQTIEIEILMDFDLDFIQETFSMINTSKEFQDSVTQLGLARE